MTSRVSEYFSSPINFEGTVANLQLQAYVGVLGSHAGVQIAWQGQAVHSQERCNGVWRQRLPRILAADRSACTCSSTASAHKWCAGLSLDFNCLRHQLLLLLNALRESRWACRRIQ